MSIAFGVKPVNCIWCKASSVLQQVKKTPHTWEQEVPFCGLTNSSSHQFFYLFESKIGLALKCEKAKLVENYHEDSIVLILKCGDSSDLVSFCMSAAMLEGWHSLMESRIHRCIPGFGKK